MNRVLIFAFGVLIAFGLVCFGEVGLFGRLYLKDDGGCGYTFVTEAFLNLFDLVAMRSSALTSEL